MLRHQINFTLSHLAATVMSFIHPFPCSHGNSAAWSCSFFYICLSLSLLLHPSPSPDPSEPSPLTPSEGVQLHPWPHKHPPPSSLLLHRGAAVKKQIKKKRVGWYKTQKRGGAWIHLSTHALKTLWSKRHTFVKAAHKTGLADKGDTTEPE